MNSIANLKNTIGKMAMNKKNVYLGKGSRVDKGAFIGCRPLRKIKRLDLRIGEGSLFMSNAVVYSGSRIGRCAIITHNCVVREENIIGDNFSLWNNSVVDYGCKIGNDVKIHCNVYVAQFTIIEDGVFIGPGTVLLNDLHPKCGFSKECLKGPYIKKGAVIGGNVTVCPYVTIGEEAVVGAGSVVTKDIPDRNLAYGSPARIICDISDIKCSKGFTGFPYR